jgi:hypothetical protein
MSLKMVARLSADDYDDVSALTNQLAWAFERHFGVPTMIEADYPIWRLLVKSPKSDDKLQEMQEWSKGWLLDPAAKPQLHATKKKAPAQLQREINEVLTKPASAEGPRYHVLYLTAGKRTMSPEEFSTVEDAVRRVRFFKARGFTAWVEDDTGKFVPVAGTRRKPSSL